MELGANDARTHHLHPQVRPGNLVRKHLPYGQKLSSWWSYRALDWQASNRGRRLDHIWATADIAAQTTAAEIVTMARGWTRKPSDHVPVIAHF